MASSVASERPTALLLFNLGGPDTLADVEPFLINLFSSRTGPVEWIGPGTEQVIEELGREGVKDALVVPLSFVSDHIETLDEVDRLFRDDATRAGIVDYRRTEALNTHPLFIEALAGLVERPVMETACPT